VEPPTGKTDFLFFFDGLMLVKKPYKILNPDLEWDGIGITVGAAARIINIQ
jgi:hypothetical protein